MKEVSESLDAEAFPEDDEQHAATVHGLQMDKTAAMNDVFTRPKKREKFELHTSPQGARLLENKWRGIPRAEYAFRQMRTVESVLQLTAPDGTIQDEKCLIVQRRRHHPNVDLAQHLEEAGVTPRGSFVGSLLTDSAEYAITRMPGKHISEVKKKNGCYEMDEALASQNVRYRPALALDRDLISDESAKRLQQLWRENHAKFLSTTIVNTLCTFHFNNESYRQTLVTFLHEHCPALAVDEVLRSMGYNDMNDFFNRFPTCETDEGAKMHYAEKERMLGIAADSKKTFMRDWNALTGEIFFGVDLTASLDGFAEQCKKHNVNFTPGMEHLWVRSRKNGPPQLSVLDTGEDDE